MAESRTLKADPGYDFLEEGMAVEEDQISAGGVLPSIATIVLLIVVIVATIKWARFEGQTAASENATYGLSSVARQADADAAAKLNRYGVSSDAPGQYQIPIERAMEIIVTESANSAGK